MKDNTKNAFFVSNLTSCLFLVVRDIPSCIMSLGYDLSEIGGSYNSSKLGGLTDLRGVDSK